MATANKEIKTVNDTPVDLMQQYVSVYLPRATGKEQNFVFVGLNGKGYTIMRGQQVRVPAPVADILAECERMIARQDEYSDAMVQLGQRDAQR